MPAADQFTGASTAAQAVGQVAYGVGRVQRLHHFEAIAGTVTEKDGELGHGCPDRPHDAGLLGRPSACLPDTIRATATGPIHSLCVLPSGVRLSGGRPSRWLGQRLHIGPKTLTHKPFIRSTQEKELDCRKLQ